jgi:anti-sigma factor RsiW
MSHDRFGRGHHVPDDLMQAFVAGEIDEHVAVHIAEHIDACAACATRAATLEPLAAAFASVSDPRAPADLVPAVLSDIERPESRPAIELVVGSLLLAAAGALAAFSGEPVRALLELGQVADALSRVGQHAAPGGALVLAMLLAAGAILFASTREGGALAGLVRGLDQRSP